MLITPTILAHAARAPMLYSAEERFRLPGREHLNTPAAVLIVIGNNTNGIPHVLLTQRREDLSDHPGQVAFPGGKIDRTDPSPAAAALREAHEEVGLAHGSVHVVAGLPIYETATGYVVSPIVAWADTLPPVTANPAEVSEVFWAPAQLCLASAGYEEHTRTMPNGRRPTFYSLAYEGRTIWGVTAAILRGLGHAIEQLEVRA